MIDLPAPVSPVIIFSPGPSSSATSSITAKFLIRKLTQHIPLPLELTLPPLELFAQDLVVAA